MGDRQIRISCDTRDTLPFSQIEEFQGNLKKRSKKEISKIITSILKYGFSFPFFVWKDGERNRCLDGHGRLLALSEMTKRHYFLDEAGKLTDDDGEPLSIPDLPVVYIDADDESEAKQKVLRLNSCYGVLDVDGFAEFAAGLDIDWDELMLPSGDLFELPGLIDDGSGTLRKSLAERFIVPPLSVFRASAGYWQERKKAWLALGIQSEKGRDDAMLAHMAALAEKAGGGKLASESIFDPVLCEIMYRWFCPQNGRILDPFAGGSVRGLVAGRLGFKYTGIDLRDEQIAANREQIAIAGDNPPEWICGDSRQMDSFLPSDFLCNFVFSCPPYADLEVYSDLPEDLSNMDYAEFREAYFDIIKKACSFLENDSFAAFVVGEARQKTNGGAYYGIIPDTVRAFEDAGLRYYDEMVLVTQIAAKALTVAEGFVKSRKIGKVHQNILVFVKGDPVKAASKCKLDMGELAVAINDAELSGETDKSETNA
ncbi:MAG: hypothetical protein J5747_00635 [Spirochaetaceae bacterium]|nr:hypothetical protein [Spirochaetaceae bacterium]